MMKKNLLLSLLCMSLWLLLFAALSPALAKADTDQKNNDIWIAFFGAQDCEFCEEVKEYFLPGFMAEYPQVKIHYLDIDDLANYKILVNIEKKYHTETNESPVFLIGDHILAGKEEIEQKLEEIVQLYLKQGGCPFPDLEDSETSLISKAASPTIYMALFTKPGCQKCDRTQSNLKYLKTKYPYIRIKQFDVSQPQNILAQEMMAQEIEVPEDQTLLAPMVMVGRDFLALDKLTYSHLESLIQKYQPSGSKCLWDNLNLNDKSGSKVFSKIEARFKKLGAFAVLGSGLLDGINPCAFATIIFLISWLAFIGKKEKDLLWVGGSFTLAVFMSYLLMGLGIFQFLKKLNTLSSLRFIIFFSMALITFILGILSLLDFFKIRQGKTKEVALQLPKVFKKRIHQVIKEKTALQGVVVAAFAMGVTISMLELACTGQVYLPTILVLTSIPEFKIHAILYLVLYNLAFILPLVIVFIVSYRGSSSKQLAEIMQKHLATTKLITAGFFFCITALLITALYLRL